MLRSLLAREGQRLLLAPAIPNPTSSASWAGLTRLFHASTPQSMPDVLVPSMGDSISEGTVSAILKNPGDKVNVDEVIAQIETDKVTIDIKSPEEGVVEKVVVASGAIVKPGDVVASISSSSSSAQARAPPSATPAAPGPAPQAPSSSHESARTPSISFPPRIAPSGERISSLPAAKQDEILGHLVGGPSSAAAKPADSAPPAVAPPAPPPPPPPAPAKSSKVATTILEAPARKQLSQREIDFINSGGAP